MTESEWQTCANPLPMLEFIRGKVSDRKLRLFAVACCRHVRLRMTDKRSYQAVDVAERYADGLADFADLAFSQKIAWSAWTTSAEAAARDVVHTDGIEAALNAARHVSWAVQGIPRAHELRAQANLLRDIFNSPFRALLFLKTSIAAWNDKTVPRLAQTIYEERAFEHLPILADALEEAGCTNLDILMHCRNPGEHVRGCWVVDLLLGKE
jgi:hypothetical protein